MANLLYKNNFFKGFLCVFAFKPKEILKNKFFLKLDEYNSKISAT